MKRFGMGAIAAFSIFAASSSFALETPWYLKFGIASTDPDAGEVEELLAYEFGTDKTFDNATGFNFTVGYQLTPYIAVEGSYLDWGETEISDSGVYGDLSSDGYEYAISGTTTLSGSTKAVGAVLSTDVNRPFSFGVKGGVHFWENTARIQLEETDTYYDYYYDTIMVNEYSADESASTDGDDTYFGIIGTYRAEKWIISLDHTVYKSEEVDPSSTTVSVGMQF